MVYASTSYIEWHNLWDQVQSVVSIGISFLLTEDFNCILNPEDKRGWRYFRVVRKIREFRDCLRQTGLLDLAYTGSRYTWCNNHFGMARVWERIDRAFVFSNSINLFSDSLVTHLTYFASDHCSISISVFNHMIRGLALFKFEKFWLSYHMLNDIIHKAWHVDDHINPTHCLSQLLQNVRTAVQNWKRRLDNLFRKEKQLNWQIYEL